MASKKKRNDASSLTAYYGPSSCCNFLSNIGYSDKIIGIPSFILRNILVDNTVSDIFNEYETCIQQKREVDFMAFLSEKLRKLPEIYASIEKCLILGRILKYIEETEQMQTRGIPFTALVSDVHKDTIRKTTCNQSYSVINYPADFRQRESDFDRWQDAQNIRRLFYYPDAEAKIQSLIQLQNKTKAHLNYILDSKMRYDPSFRAAGLQEIGNILSKTFVIIAQPHCNNNPVLVYDGKRSESCKAKVSVVIVSLLHDLKETYSDMINLEDIELKLNSTSNLYKLDGSQKLSWKTCELHINPGERPRTVQYAELSIINIKQSSKIKKGSKPNEELYTLMFPIIIHVKLCELKISQKYEIQLQSLPFAISSHTDHISFFTAKVIISDIERIAQIQSTIDCVDIIVGFLNRYFIHRTGVEPKKDLRDYFLHELTGYNNARQNCQSLEDKFMDFLVEFVNQVEYMRKHPVLSMFYEDGLFLGPCNSTAVKNTMTALADVKHPTVALRFNSIKVLYAVNPSITASKSMQAAPCFVRVIIHNGRREKPDDRTFDSRTLCEDLLKFVSTSNQDMAHRVRILSTLNGAPNNTTFKSYTDFHKYYHDRLLQIFKTDPIYKDINDILIDIGNANDNRSTNSSGISEDSMPSTSSATSINKNISNTTTNCDASEPILKFHPPPTNEELLERMDDDDILKYILSKKHLCEKLLSHLLQLQIPDEILRGQQQPSTIQQLLPPFQQMAFDQQQASSSQPRVFHITQNNPILSNQEPDFFDILTQPMDEGNQQFDMDVNFLNN